ncbi:Imm51 family immunity protein [Paenibacillus aurantiacus]|uniref:Imm51 family immunity protein n=1 Tax=Paenibacillus aurantiacus TaxID=1936118 RepID=A0ABV5KN62_9BACL
MEPNLYAQIMQWHKDNEHQQIVDTLLKIPPADRDYDMISSIGRAYNNLSLYEEALEQLTSIAEQGKNDPLWYYRIGYSYYYLKRYEEAAGVLSAALELDPDDQHSAWLLDRSRSKWQKQQQAESRRASSQQKDSGAIPFEGMDLDSFWEDSDYAREQYVSDPPTDELIASVEEELGYKLPAAYIALMKRQNGGIPRHTSFPTDVATSWADDHIAITGIMGIGRDKSYSICGDLGSSFMIEEWGYPDIGVVICDCPSAGHDVVMLDYRHCGKDGEPEVIHVDQEDDYEITFLAPDFETFIRGLVHDEVYDTSEEDKADDLRKVAEGKFSPLLTELCGHATEVDRLESKIRSVCTRIVQEKGHFSFHADERSHLMYDVQFWLYTNAFPTTSRQQYLDTYDQIIAFGGEFGQGGYAPDFISDWLDGRIGEGLIVEENGVLRFTDEARDAVIAKLSAEAEAEQESEDAGRTKDLAPFILVEQNNGGKSVILTAGSYLANLFANRADEGFEGNGYDWASLAAVFLNERMPELADTIRFDPEADMFCAYSSNGAAVEQFARAFKSACEDEALIHDLFSRAELD